jgi:hypothetical protein
MNWCLLSLFLFMSASNIYILKTQMLSFFDSYFMRFILGIQVIAIYSLFTKERYGLYITHILYITTLLLGSIFADNKCILYLIIAIMVIAKIAVYCVGDCPYHTESKRLEWFSGGEKNTIFTDNGLYMTCFIIILYRYLDTIIKKSIRNFIFA